MTPKSIIIGLLLVGCLLSGAALAQESPTTTSTATPANETGPTAVATVDKLTIITDYYLNEDDDLVLEFYSEGGNTLSITETTSTDGATSVRVRQETTPRGSSKTTIDVLDRSDPSVLITTRFSLQENRGTKISVESGQAIIGGPFDGTDVRDAGVGGALGVALVVVFSALTLVSGDSEEGERIA
jgi:hypothetical protein